MSFKLSVTNKPIMLSVVELNAVVINVVASLTMKNTPAYSNKELTIGLKSFY
jgi:hypothetical protein